MTDMTTTLTVQRPDADDDFSLKALKIVSFSGFAILVTILGFVFLPIAGFALAAWITWQGFGGRWWKHDNFALRALSIVAFTGFAVLATILGFVFLPIAGVALAVLFFWRGFGVLSLGPRPMPAPMAPREPAMTPTGNAAFDAYRADTLRRLEEERERFEGFLARLREAKDKSEFDDFLDDRARRARDLRDQEGGREPAA